jgi:hypothetical protein
MPDYTPTRREVIASTIGLATAGTATVLTTSESSSAASLSGEFTIPDVQREVTSDVTGVSLSVNGTVSWDADALPTRSILRLEVGRDGEFQQLDGMKLPDLSRDYSYEYSFSGVDLLAHNALEVADVNPTGIGDSTSVDLTARLSLSVKRDGTVLAEESLRESVGVVVSRGAGAVDVSLGGSGNVSVSEETG